MEANNYTVISMTVVEAKPNVYGNRVIAAFDLATSGIKVFGCVLMEQDNGGIICSVPTGKTKSGNKVRVAFGDAASAITERAVAAYTALTGRELSAE